MTLGDYIAITIKTLTNALNRDLFVIEGFSYLEDDSDILISYRFSGKRKPVLNVHLTKLIKDGKKLNCFSREDVCEASVLYGRLMEKKIQNQKNIG